MSGGGSPEPIFVTYVPVPVSTLTVRATSENCMWLSYNLHGVLVTYMVRIEHTYISPSDQDVFQAALALEEALRRHALSSARGR